MALGLSALLSWVLFCWFGTEITRRSKHQDHSCQAPLTALSMTVSWAKNLFNSSNTRGPLPTSTESPREQWYHGIQTKAVNGCRMFWEDVKRCSNSVWPSHNLAKMVKPIGLYTLNGRVVQDLDLYLNKTVTHRATLIKGGWGERSEQLAERNDKNQRGKGLLLR